MTLYLKYRPKNLDELDLVEVAGTLKKIVSSGEIPHAFLFAGPKGTGKTSAARILAKIINCEELKDLTPCDKCDQCMSISKGNNLDVIELDAASNRGIDDVRILREAVKLSPAKAKKKIYIIDEAHMLTPEASNALLKTLEEPPNHVIFVLATTNPEKLIDTIRSRTTTVNFRKAGIDEILRSLRRVVDGEKIAIDEKSLLKIAEIANGAFRDAIKLLEQFKLEGDGFLVGFKTLQLGNLIDALVARDEKSLITEIEQSVNLGVSSDYLCKTLIEITHKALLNRVGIEGKAASPEDGLGKLTSLTKDDLVFLSELLGNAFKNIDESPIEQLALEIAVVKWCQKKVDSAPAEDKKAKLEDGSAKAENENKNNNIQNSSVNDLSSIQSSDVRLQTSESLIQMDDSVWNNILSAVHPVNVSIEGLLRASRPVAYDGHTLTLGVYYKFHKERLEDIRHRKILEETIAQVLNAPTKVVCTLVDPPVRQVSEEAKTKPVLTESTEPDIIKAAEEIFGS